MKLNVKNAELPRVKMTDNYALKSILKTNYTTTVYYFRDIFNLYVIIKK